MSYFNLDKDQTRYLRDLVKGEVVADLGCGMGMLTKLMARMGASMVHGVDKKVLTDRNSKRVHWHQSYLAYWQMPLDVEIAVVSWPQNTPLQGITELLQAVPHVVYIGKNTDGTACGNPALMRYLSGREAHTYLPNNKNTLIHYGSGDRKLQRCIYHEEYAALAQGILCYAPSVECITNEGWENRFSRA